MKIVNYITDSTIECAPFSWGISLFSFGCNLHCKMCVGYNYETVTNSDNIIGEAEDIIRDNITPLHDSVVFIGGEPTIWGNSLVDNLKFVKKLGLKTKIFSNGICFDIIEDINKQHLCDAWSIDFKGVNNLFGTFGVSEDKYFYCFNKTIQSIINSNLPLEIRTTFFEDNISDRAEICSYCNNIIQKYNRIQPNIYKRYIEQQDVRGIL